jgi:uncharacterized protein (TIGR03118 family)
MQAVANGYQQTNLVSNQPGGAQIQDSNLVNPWGISYSPTGPFWISDNGTGVSTLYSVNPATNTPTKLGLTVTIPGAGNVTGQVHNGNTSAFNADSFLFVSEDGTVSGWRGGLGGPNAETLQTASPGNIYKGTTEITTGSDSYLYSSNFGTGNIDVLKGNAASPNLTGTFTDPTLPAGYSPFNIQVLGGNLLVTYAFKQNPGDTDETAGTGLGVVDEYNTNGDFVKRLITGGPLNAPWGMALAPSNFGDFSNALLVGNFGDGLINALDPATGTFLGSLKDKSGNTSSPISFR